jgi:type I restriction enzyme S subunit
LLRNPEAAVFASYLIRFRPGDSVIPQFVAYFLQSPDYWSQIRDNTAGIAIPNVNATKLQSIPIPVPPLDEQKRIVAEIEKQFTRLDAGVASLRRVHTALKRYRASVLKAAYEGRLVPIEAELARQENRSYESADVLLQRALRERREKWNGKGKYKEPVAVDATNLSSLPEGWRWVTWDAILVAGEGAFKRGPFGSALTKSIFVQKGFKVYEQYCPINDDCSFARYYITPEKFKELRGFEVRAGDYLISCSGVTLGRITRVPDKFEPGIINQALLRVRINEGVIKHNFFLRLFRSAIFQQRLFDSSTGSAIPNVKGVKDLKALPIPLPPLAEQERIIAEVEERLSVIDELEALTSTELQRAIRLRQSMLSQAFGRPASNEARGQ